jgi:outer membrane protein OmpA-like peptidoglycan-associated protein/Mg-chelatase subunit ChlD
MKKYFVLLILAFSLSSCDLIRSWLDGIRGGEAPMLDQKPPKDYNPVFLSDYKDISQLENTPNFVISSIDGNTSDKVKVFFHLTDGKYFLKGAESNQYKDIWCDLKLNGVNSINNYTIRKVESSEVQDLAIAIVMDLSGSMGVERAKVMQKAVMEIIENKRPNDLITLINYDSKVKVENQPTADVEQLKQYHQIKGLQGFGGLTATKDAIDKAIEVLSTVDKKYKRVVMAFTDGSDNSSKKPEDDVILNAKNNLVMVNTIDYGYYTTPGLLEKTAKETNGIYHHIYMTDEFNYVFEDLYFRLNNYYVLEFEQPTYGKHSFSMKVCIKDTKLESEREFNNIPLPGTVTLLNVYFDTNKSDLKPESNDAMDRLLKLMALDNSLKIEIHGHTDNVGKEESNMILSQKRAEAVKDVLIRRGIEKSRIKAIGFGFSKPVADNSTPEGRAKNRRTEFIVVN